MQKAGILPKTFENANIHKQISVFNITYSQLLTVKNQFLLAKHLAYPFFMI